MTLARRSGRALCSPGLAAMLGVTLLHAWSPVVALQVKVSLLFWSAGAGEGAEARGDGDRVPGGGGAAAAGTRGAAAPHLRGRRPPHHRGAGRHPAGPPARLALPPCGTPPLPGSISAAAARSICWLLWPPRTQSIVILGFLSSEVPRCLEFRRLQRQMATSARIFLSPGEW